MTAVQKLACVADFKNLAQIAEFVTAAAAQSSLNKKEIYAVEMAVDEACTNIIEHAYGGRKTGEIQITCQIEGDGLRIIICDQGNPFDPNQVPELEPNAPLEARTRRGMGLFYIYKLMNSVEYKFDLPHGNQLTLVKYRERA